MDIEKAQDTEVTEDLEVQPEEAEGVKGGFNLGKNRTFDGAHKGTDRKHFGTDVL